MYALSSTILLVFLFPSANAQQTSDSPSNHPKNSNDLFVLTSNSHSNHSKNYHDIVVFATVTSIIFVLILLIFLYTKFCWTIEIPNIHGLIRLRSSLLSGIDKKVVESFPIFRFSSLKGSKEGLECAVCLLEFEESESLRLLPKCKHAFHINCIDKWLESQSSCPLCRYKYDSYDIANYKLTNPTSSSVLDVYIEREEDQHALGSSRFMSLIGASFRELGKSSKMEEPLVGNNEEKYFDKLKHDIIVSEIVQERRWSDANSSDLIFLNSEMLNLISSKRFSMHHENTKEAKMLVPRFVSCSTKGEGVSTSSRSTNHL